MTKENRLILYKHYKATGQDDRAEDVVKGNPNEKTEFDKEIKDVVAEVPKEKDSKKKVMEE